MFSQSKAPKGYYIYGDVGKLLIQLIHIKTSKEDLMGCISLTLSYLLVFAGTGKTMVMDMFYSYVETNKKKRVHFHGFMLDVHQSEFCILPS